MNPSRRLLLQQELETLLGSRNVYFQPPESIKLQFPCYIYKYEHPDSLRADDTHYRLYDRYQLTYVTKNPVDPLINETMLHFQLCTQDTSFTKDNLNHYIFSIYF
jgi:hypothetical protein